MFARLFLLALCCLTLSIHAEEDSGRADAIPEESMLNKNTQYIEGYLQALIDMHYHEYNVRAKINGSIAILTNLPSNKRLAKSIKGFVGEFPGITAVQVVAQAAPDTVFDGENVLVSKNPEEGHRVDGIWFPQSNVLFPQLIADPKRVGYSMSWRFRDDIIGKNTAFVSLGDHFPIFRWRNVWPMNGDMQIGISGCAWAYFDMAADPALVNTDYFVGIPLTYSFDDWAFRLRLSHTSAHLGDEYIISHPTVTRLNPSMEAVDIVASYFLTPAIRTYAGMGYIFRKDSSFKVKPFYAEAGAELRLFGNKDAFNRLYIQPFLAMHFRLWQDHDYEIDSNYTLGVELSKLRDIGRKVRLYAEYHKGQSFLGQFSRQKTSYWALNFSYGF